MIIADVLYEYEQLRNRALEAVPSEAGYIDELWERWDSKLRWYAAHRDVPNMDHVTTVIRDPLTSPQALLEWVDAYPSHAIAQITGQP